MQFVLGYSLSNVFSWSELRLFYKEGRLFETNRINSPIRDIL